MLRFDTLAIGSRFVGMFELVTPNPTLYLADVTSYACSNFNGLQWNGVAFGPMT